MTPQELGSKPDPLVLQKMNWLNYLKLKVKERKNPNSGDPVIGPVAMEELNVLELRKTSWFMGKMLFLVFVINNYIYIKYILFSIILLKSITFIFNYPKSVFSMYYLSVFTLFE